MVCIIIITGNQHENTFVLNKSPLRAVNDGIGYTAGAKHCNRACPLRNKCTTMKTNVARSIRRNVNQDYIDYQLSKYGNAEWKRLLKKRQTIIEGTFGDAKVNHGLRTAKMRGIKKVREQSLMTAIVQNIKKMIKEFENNEKMIKVKLFLKLKRIVINYS